MQVGTVQRWKKLRIVTGDFGWEIAHAAVCRVPRQDCSPYRGLHVRRESLGCVPRSRAIFCRPASNLSVRFAFFFASLLVGGRRTSCSSGLCDSKRSARNTRSARNALSLLRFSNGDKESTPSPPEKNTFQFGFQSGFIRTHTNTG